MLNAKEIQESTFSTAMSGYKRDEVDALLDKITADYGQFEALLASQQARIAALEKEISDKDISMSSINTVLLSAQKLADSIVADAKKQAEETVEAANAEAESIKLRTKKALEEIDAVLTAQKNKAQAEVDEMLSDAARKSEGMILAAKDSVTREQLLFDKLKSEVAEFKHHLKESYKAHIESLSKLPDEVVLNPMLAASTVEEIINNEPDLLKFIEKSTIEEEVEIELPETASAPEEVIVPEETPAAEEPAAPEAEAVAAKLFETPEEDIGATRQFSLEELAKEEPEAPAAGFVIKPLEEDDEEESTPDEPPTFSKGFFAKRK